MTSRRSFIAAGLGTAAGLWLWLPRAEAQSRKPAITVYRDPT